jgi:hypothetical protein
VAQEVLPIAQMAACTPSEPTQDDLRMATEVLESIASALGAPLPPLAEPPSGIMPIGADMETAVETAALCTPLDMQMGLTTRPLRWGILTAGRICKDFAQAIKLAVSSLQSRAAAEPPSRLSRRAH